MNIKVKLTVLIITKQNKFQFPVFGKISKYQIFKNALNNCVL